MSIARRRNDNSRQLAAKRSSKASAMYAQTLVPWNRKVCAAALFVLLLAGWGPRATAGGQSPALKFGPSPPAPPAGNSPRGSREIPATGSRTKKAGADSAPAATNEVDLERTPSLDAVERYALEHNPAIRAAREAWRAAESRITVEGSYENPMIEYMPDTYNMAETRAGPETGGVAFSQRIPFPGKLTMRARAASEQEQAAHETLLAVSQETLRKIRSSYADFYLADRALQVNSQTMVLARQFEAIAEAKYRVGKVPEQDVIQSQEELSRLATQRVGFSQERNSAVGRIDTLLDRAPRAPLGTPVEMTARKLKVPLSGLIEADRVTRPEIRAEKHLVQAREYSLTLAKMGYLPDFSIGGEYIGVDGHMGVPGFIKDGHDIWAATLGFSVPIWIDRVRAQVDEAGAQLAQEKFTRRNVEDAVNDQVQDAYERLMAAASNEAIYRTTLLPQTAERIRAAVAGYQTGIVDFLTLVDSLKSYEDVRLLRYQSVRAYQVAAADLIRAVGRPIAGIAR